MKSCSNSFIRRQQLVNEFWKQVGERDPWMKINSRAMNSIFGKTQAIYWDLRYKIRTQGRLL